MWIASSLPGIEKVINPEIERAITPALTLSRPGPGKLTLETAGGTCSLERHQVDGFVSIARMDVVVDLDRELAIFGGTTVAFQGRVMALRILGAMARRQGSPITLEEITREVWGRTHAPEVGVTTVSFHVSLLRKILEKASIGLGSLVTRVSGGYRLKPGLRMGTIHRQAPVRNLPRDDAAVIALVRDRGFIDNRGYCEMTGKSRTTALRDLQRLVDLGALEPLGRGRGARYRLSGAFSQKWS
jgi:DNA-binding winged helix-turn-helix (wHTH) protein